MKIAVWHNLSSGGAKRALYEQVRGLKRRGHTIEAWCPSSADRDYLPLTDLVTEHVVPFAWDDAPDVGRIANLMYPIRAVRAKLGAMKRSCELCAEQISAGGFDMLFANPCIFFRVPPIGRMVGKLPKVLYLQEPFRWLYEASPTLPWVDAGSAQASRAFGSWNLRRMPREWIRLQALRLQASEERLNAASFDRILVNSLYSRESVLRAYGIDADVCYLGIASDLFRITGETRENFVVGVGSETFEKGVDIAIRAVASIAKPKRPPLVWIANLTSNRYHDEMQGLARSLEVDFVVRTRIADTELVSLLNRAALMMYTSRLEPFGLAPLEANSCGTPVVAVAEGGVRETQIHMTNGLLVQGRDPIALGREVLRLMEDKELASQLGMRGRALVETNWTWEAAIDRLEHSLYAAAGGAAAMIGGERSAPRVSDGN